MGMQQVASSAIISAISFSGLPQWYRTLAKVTFRRCPCEEEIFSFTACTILSMYCCRPSFSLKRWQSLRYRFSEEPQIRLESGGEAERSPIFGVPVDYVLSPIVPHAPDKNWGSLSLPSRFKPDLGPFRTFGVDLSTSPGCGCRRPSPCVGHGTRHCRKKAFITEFSL